MSRFDADVIVVGAGPGGAMTGLLLARLGLDVLLLDRARFPRPKPCGDCMSAAATELLERVGLLDRVREQATPIERWEIVAPDGRVATGRLDRTALALERRVLDALLVDAAVEAGCRLRQAHVTDLARVPGATDARAPAHDRDGATGERTGAGGAGSTGRVRGVVTREGERLTARLVVGADGLRSVVARKLGVIRRAPRLRKVSLTAHVPGPTGPAALPERHGEMHVLPGGVLGVAPAGPRYNLTLVVDDDHSEGLRDGAEAFFRSWLQRVPSVQRRFGDLPIDRLLASGPFDWPTRSPVADGAALVGDAAGYYDPFTGQGIYHAMASAERLVGSLGPVLAHAPGDADAGAAAGGADADALDAALRRYAAAKRALTRPVRRVQRLVEAVVSRPWLANPVLGRLGEARPAMDRLIDVTGDLRPPRSLLSATFVSSFLFPPNPERR